MGSLTASFDPCLLTLMAMAMTTVKMDVATSNGSIWSNADCGEVETMRNLSSTNTFIVVDFSNALDITAVRVIIITLYSIVFLTCLTGKKTYELAQASIHCDIPGRHRY